MNETSRALAVEYVRDGQWEDVNRMLVHIDDEIRHAAAAVCCGFASQEGLDIAPALETLEKLLGDEEDVAKEAAFALSWQHLRKEEWERVTALLSHERSLVRQLTAYALSEAARERIDLSEIVPALEKNLVDEANGVVYCTVRALVFHHAAQEDGAAVQALLGHDEARVAEMTGSILTERLTTSAKGGDKAAVEAWLEMGAGIDTLDDEDKSVLVVAAISGSTELVSFLLERGAGIDVPDGPGRTALMHASYQGHKDVVELLLEKGADINLGSNVEYTALDYACNGNELAIAQLLHDRGAKMGDKNSVLNMACSNGNVDVVKIVVQHDPDTSYQDENGFTGLMYAAMNGHLEVAEFLLEKGADPNVAREADTALVYATRCDKQDVVALLKKYMK